eukprot:gene11414-9921_t
MGPQKRSAPKPATKKPAKKPSTAGAVATNASVDVLEVLGSPGV